MDPIKTQSSYQNILISNDVKQQDLGPKTNVRSKKIKHKIRQIKINDQHPIPPVLKHKLEPVLEKRNAEVVQKKDEIVPSQSDTDDLKKKLSQKEEIIKLKDKHIANLSEQIRSLTNQLGIAETILFNIYQTAGTTINQQVILNVPNNVRYN